MRDVCPHFNWKAGRLPGWASLPACVWGSERRKGGPWPGRRVHCFDPRVFPFWRASGSPAARRRRPAWRSTDAPIPVLERHGFRVWRRIRPPLGVERGRGHPRRERWGQEGDATTLLRFPDGQVFMAPGKQARRFQGPQAHPVRVRRTARSRGRLLPGWPGRSDPGCPRWCARPGSRSR